MAVTSTHSPAPPPCGSSGGGSLVPFNYEQFYNGESVAGFSFELFLFMIYDIHKRISILKYFQNDLYYMSLCAKLCWVLLLRGVFLNTILSQCKQEIFGVGRLVRGWNWGKCLGVEAYHGSIKWEKWHFLAQFPVLFARHLLPVKQAAFTPDSTPF